MMLSYFPLLLLPLGVLAGPTYTNLNSVDGRGAIVEMLEWKWTDVAKECEAFLGPHGYAAVQISPPQVDGRGAIVEMLEWKWTDVAKECEAFLGPHGYAAVQISPPQVDGRGAIVEMLEWKWTDVAKECEAFLGPHGYAAVQISPPQVDGRGAIVEMLEWKWTDVAKECEAFLGPHGYAAVQISPPQVDGRGAIVEMLEWKWTDVAKECEAFLGPHGYAAVQISPPQVDGRGAIVEMLEWKWTDVAKECEAFLGPHGYAAVQISPPQVDGRGAIVEMLEWKWTDVAKECEAFLGPHGYAAVQISPPQVDGRGAIVEMLEWKWTDVAKECEAFLGPHGYAAVQISPPQVDGRGAIVEMLEWKWTDVAKECEAFLGPHGYAAVQISPPQVDGRGAIVEMLEWKWTDVAKECEAFLGPHGYAAVQISPPQVDGRGAIVEMLEWKWTDVAKECEAFLGPHGYAAVQISPPQVDGRGAIVEMLEWKWTDVAKECEAFLGPHGYAAVQISPPQVDGRGAIVEMLEWKWTDVAKECEAFLGPHGYAAVQISPPQVDGRGAIVEMLEWKWTDVAKECEAFLGPHGYAAVQISPPQVDGRGAIVEMLEWKWTDVAKECEAFLGPHGYAAVQISPPQVDGRGAIVEMLEWKWTDVAKECEAFLGPHGYAAVQISPPQVDGRGAIVEMLEWKWTDVAKECEAFLGPHGYAAVQISPPQEHLYVTKPMAPWWERYQPVSYKLDSRSGDRAQFIDMVQRCNKAGVRIIADAVINHMTGSERGFGHGTAGSAYNATAQSFPGVPFTIDDFHAYGQAADECPQQCQCINDWDNAHIVQNCRLVGLLDLHTQKQAVRQKIAGYLNDLISIGVAGFRVDAAKHINPQDLKAIMDLTTDLNQAYFPKGSRALVYQEVISWGNSPIKGEQWKASGRVCNFQYGKEVTQAIRGGGGRGLGAFGDISGGWGLPYLDSDFSFVFIDDHDTQRQSGAGVLNYMDKHDYTIAIGFMYALPYGATRMMSSYEFTYADTNTGPPHNSNYSTADVKILPSGQCGGGWVCEHRWPAIAGMAKFRWHTSGAPSTHWTTGSGGQAAFARGSQGFYAVNKDGGAWTRIFQTGLAEGVYCDLVSGDLVGNKCTGKSFEVRSDGTVSLAVTQDSQSTSPQVAITYRSRVGGHYTLPSRVPTTPTLAPKAGWQRTVVFIEKRTSFNEFVFIRGGESGGCTHQFNDQNPCMVPIRHNTTVPKTIYGRHYAAWAQGDSFLDWYGAQSGQGEYNYEPADGTPMVPTSNVPSSPNYSPLNVFGGDYWMVELEMECSKTKGGWFELKGHTPEDGWESGRVQGSCGGSAGGGAPFASGNHVARCGALNVFHWGRAECTINAF